jgi:hypothetical protein
MVVAFAHVEPCTAVEDAAPAADLRHFLRSADAAQVLGSKAPR